MESRRSFIKNVALGSLLLTNRDLSAFGEHGATSEPWYRTATCWGQVNIGAHTGAGTVFALACR
ncbi:MAG TPA: hypothetical protein VHC48_14110 [Puia sp.]|nr:hypothetical protein [Puia sp.]